MSKLENSISNFRHTKLILTYYVNILALNDQISSQCFDFYLYYLIILTYKVKILINLDFL